MCGTPTGQRFGGELGDRQGDVPDWSAGAGSYSEAMDEARPLRDVFADLVGDEAARQAHAADPDGFLAAAGHADLPDGLVGEAIVSYADTAPAEVAEHLAPFVMAHSPVPVEDDLPAAALDAAHGLDLLSTAPAEPVLDDPTLAAHAGAELVGPEAAGHDAAGHDAAGHDAAGELADPFGLDFGHGDTGEPVHTGHSGPGPVDAGLVDPAGHEAAGEPDWFAGEDHPDPASELDHAAQLDHADELDHADQLDHPAHPTDLPGDAVDHDPGDITDL
jgi:hypothetical protein